MTILPLQMHNAQVVEAAEKIYADLMDSGIDALVDDRDERAGIKFNDADLLGIPLRVTAGAKGVQKGQVEIKLRTETESVFVPIDTAGSFAKEKVNALYDSLK